MACPIAGMDLDRSRELLAPAEEFARVAYVKKIAEFQLATA